MSMKEGQETNSANGCEHCGRNFLRESTLLKHLCEHKRRWLDKDRPANRIGFGAWKDYFNTHHPSKKRTEYADFYKSHYYTAFIKFGNYCHDIGVLNPAYYAQWLVKNKISIDNWNSDKTYTRYIVDYLHSEDAMDAVKRSIETLLDLSTADSIRIQDSFKYLNKNKLCHIITTGKISPWILYNSSGGVDFLSGLTTDQTGLIFDYIQPERWAIKFRKNQAEVKEIKSLLDGIPL